MNTQQRTRAFLSTAIAVIGTLSLLLLSLFLNPQHKNVLGLFFLYQLITLGVSGLVILGTWLTTGRQLNFFHVGNWSAPATPVKLLGISAKDNWRRIGFTFAVIISGMTLMFMIINTYGDLGAIAPRTWLLAIGCAVPLSIVNAFNEEIITRWSIAEGFTGSLTKYAPWVSAVIFGSVHYFGTPGGVIGSVMAGFLAWFATRSIQDTKGLGWAWVIHFVQDMIILSITLALFI